MTRVLGHKATLLLTIRFALTEFKEIRKEWKARKKEEENQRKAEEERQRQAAQAAGQSEPQNSTEPAQASSASTYTPGIRPQLPPIGYQPAQAGQVPSGHYQAPPSGIEQMQYGNNQLYQNYPQSPYGQGNQMYQQRQTPLQGNEETDADAEPDPDVPAGNYQH
jgi:transcription factor CON7